MKNINIKYNKMKNINDDEFKQGLVVGFIAGGLVWGVLFLLALMFV